MLGGRADQRMAARRLVPCETLFAAAIACSATRPRTAKLAHACIGGYSRNDGTSAPMRWQRSHHLRDSVIGLCRFGETLMPLRPGAGLPRAPQGFWLGRAKPLKPRRVSVLRWVSLRSTHPTQVTKCTRTACCLGGSVGWDERSDTHRPMIQFGPPQAI
jgi:hypothetical protein